MAKRSNTYRFCRLEFFAERGLITLIDLDAAADSEVQPDEAIQRLRPGQFMKRVIAVRMGVQDEYPDEVRRANKLMEEATIACKLAKAQGDPGDPRVQEHYAKHMRRSRILTSQGIPVGEAEANRILGPVGGQQNYKIRHKGDARTTLLQGVDVVPDVSIDQSQMVTPKRSRNVKINRRKR